MNIAFIGLGIMGSRMAANLIKHHSITVWNRSLEATESFAEQGATVADSAVAAVKDADLVFSMLSTPEAVQEVFLDEGAALDHLRGNTIWVDCSTVNPSFSKQANELAKKAGIRFLDAPVAGSKPQAQNAELLFFVGGESKTLEVVQSYLEVMGKKVMHLGDAGMGSAFKMVVNIMLAQSMLVFSEAVQFGEKMGIDRELLLNVLPNTVVAAPFTKVKAEAIRSNNYEVQFPLEWMRKDLHLACLTAYEQGAPLYLANVTKEKYTEALEAGLGRLDFSAIHKHLEQR